MILIFEWFIVYDYYEECCYDYLCTFSVDMDVYINMILYLVVKLIVVKISIYLVLVDNVKWFFKVVFVLVIYKSCNWFV